MRILWLRRAETDLNQIFDYLSEFDDGAASRILDLIRDRVATLADLPGSGRSGRIPDTRELAIARTPYVVAYTVDRRIDAVIVLRVLHGSRRWPENI